MPQILQEMMDETDPHINVEQITYPGFSLDAHLDNIIEESSVDNVKTRKKLDGEITETEKKIKEKEWDIIVMQTGGVTILIPEIRNKKIDPAIKEIQKLSIPETQFFLFNTWTPKIEYPQEYCYPSAMVDRDAKPGDKICSPKISNEADYFYLLNAGYGELAETNNTILTQHATLFNKIEDDHPEIYLLEDNMHPSKQGAFFSACIFYELFTGKKANDLKYDSDLEKKTASILKRSVS